jgi:hypothetical protein
MGDDRPTPVGVGEGRRASQIKNLRDSGLGAELTGKGWRETSPRVVACRSRYRNLPASPRGHCRSSRGDVPRRRASLSPGKHVGETKTKNEEKLALMPLRINVFPNNSNAFHAWYPGVCLAARLRSYAPPTVHTSVEHVLFRVQVSALTRANIRCASAG